MTEPHPFAQAVTEFIGDLIDTEDRRSPFYKEVLTEGSRLLLRGGADGQSLESAKALARCIEGLDNEQQRRGKTRWLGKKLQPLVNGLTQFTCALDTMIQAGPAPAALIYGGAKLVLQLAKGYTDYFEKMVDTLAEVGSILECYHSLGCTYSSAESMRKVLFESYKNILIFWQDCARLFNRNGAKTFLKGIVKPFDSEWTTIRSRLERDLRLVQLYAVAIEGEAAKRREETTESRAIAMQEDTQRAKRLRIVAWLNGFDDAGTIDERMDLKPHLQAKHRGTCQWMLTDPKYLEWVGSTSNENLWLHANPGTGKTVLCASVIENLESEGRKVAYFFCSFQEPTKRRISSVLRSLAVQLLRLQPQTPSALEELYESEMHHGQTKLRNEEVILQVLRALLRRIDRVHIVLDGLDECDDRPQALRLLTEVFKFQTLGIVKWFWASRLEAEFEELASSVNSRVIHATKTQVENDMKNLLGSFLEERQGVAENSDKSVEDWITAADGNFLWLCIMLRTLTGCDLTCPAEIKEELTKFPTGLTGCYLRVLQQILKKPTPHQRLARKLFILVAFAEQPLTLCEVLDALSVKNGSKDHGGPGSRPFEPLVKQLCCPLISLDDSRGSDGQDIVLRFFHKSTRDFFMQDPDKLRIMDESRMFFPTPKQAHLEMAGTCLTYLSYSCYEQPRNFNWQSNNFAVEHCFLRYAALYWHSHLKEAGSSKETYEMADRFLRSPQFWNCMLVQAAVAPYLFGRLTACGDNHFQMNGPQNLGSGSGDYITSPLPGWLENSTEGQVLLRDYTTFISEWHPVFIQHSHAVLQCHPGVLGSDSILSRGALEVPQDAVIEMGTGSGNIRPLQDSYINNEWRALASQTTKSGLRVFTLDQEQPTEAYEQFLRQYHINLEPSSSSEGVLLKEKRIWKAKAPRENALLHLGLSDTPGQYAIWSWDRITMTMTRHEGSESTVFKAPQEITRALSPSTSKRMQGTLQHHHSGRRTMVTYLETSKKWEDSSDDSGYDDSDSDVSISEEEDDDEKDVSTQLDTCLRILIAIDGLDEPLWFHWESQSDILVESTPASHARHSVIVWPANDDEFMLADLHTRKAQRLPSPMTDSTQRGSVISRDLQFSTCGNFLYCLTTRQELKEDSLRTTYHFDLRTLSLDLSTNNSEWKNIIAQSPNCQTITVSYSAPRLEGNTAIALKSWSTKWLYLAVNTPSAQCTIKMIRLPLTRQSPSADTPSPSTIQTTHSPLYVPCTFSRRSPVFHTVHTPSNDHIAFLLSSPSPTKRPASDTPLLPAILLRSTASLLGGWRAWDEKTDGRESGLDEFISSADYMKGKYAAADQRFSVPIRSGLDWRKSVFVSCW